jgi:type I restriction enzyme S subunit
MNATRLLEHYERIADAADAVPHLRRFILTLAVRGKLVPQDSKDEPASVLLQRIAAEQARQVKAGEIRKQEIASLDLSDVRFIIPKNWAWTRLGSIGNWGSGSTPARGSLQLYGGGKTWLKSGELNDSRHLVGSVETVTELAIASGSFRLNRPGDVLIAMYGATIGKVAILGENAVTNQAVCGCTPYSGVFNEFLFLFLLSHRDQFHSASEGGAQPNISKIKIVRTPFPLPPFAEQRRIVAKVDKLMRLCDQLEVARADREATRDRLAIESLARVDMPDPDPLKFADQCRFALENLAAVTMHSTQITRLRQTILDLAVLGKLVAQDKGDEPALELLNRARAAKQQLMRERGISRDSKPEKSMAKIEASSPKHWCWVHLHDVALVQGGKRLPAGASFSSVPTPHIYIRVTDMKRGTISTLNPKYISPLIQKIIRKYTINASDLYITIAGTIGEVGNVPDELDGQNLTENAAKIVFREINKAFLCLVLKASDVQGQFQEKTKQMAQPKLALKRIAGARLPLPPLAEQGRIVDKVHELMALCDLLGASLATGDRTRRHLLDALLDEALEPADRLASGRVAAHV